MKTIKQLDAFHPDQSLKQFFTKIHLTQILFILSVTGSSLLQIISPFFNSENMPINQPTDDTRTYSFWSFFMFLSVSDFWLFLITSLAEFKKEQQRKGSLSFLISILVRSQIVMIVHYMIRTQWFEDYPRWNDYFSPTSIPLQLLLMISISQAISQPRSISYFCIKPFQIKTIFKPFFFLILIQVFALRVDILIAAFIEILLSVLKIDKRITSVSQKIEEKCPKITKLQVVRYLKSLSSSPQFNQLDIIKTNNSVILQEK